MIELSSMTCECCYLLISHHRDLDIPFVHDLGISLGHELASSYKLCVRTFLFTCELWGRDESVRHGAGSQWIVAARPLCHLQCPVAYLSRLQRIQPTARWEGSFEAAVTGTSGGGLNPLQ